jgi:Amt family ammonium transporter
VFASKGISGVTGSVATQALGAVVVVVYSGAMSFALLWLTKVIVGLRVDDNAELVGLDVSQHREHIGG